MRLWQLFLLALESLRRSRLRAALTMAGIAIATGALVSMFAFALGLKREAERPIEELGLLNNIEVGIRAYDPCLSCATHALGQMPLEVTLFDAEGEPIDRRVRS